MTQTLVIPVVMMMAVVTMTAVTMTLAVTIVMMPVRKRQSLLLVMKRSQIHLHHLHTPSPLKKPTHGNKKRRTRSSRNKTTVQQCAPRKTVTILCDSIPKSLPQNIMSSQGNFDVFVDNKAATLESAVNYVQNMSREPRDRIIIHTGINHIINETVDDISRKMWRLERNLLANQPEHVAFSSVIMRNGSAKTKHKIQNINRSLKQICQRNSWLYINNDNIRTSCVTAGVHLSSRGELKLLCKFHQQVRSHNL